MTRTAALVIAGLALLAGGCTYQMAAGQPPATVDITVAEDLPADIARAWLEAAPRSMDALGIRPPNPAGCEYGADALTAPAWQRGPQLAAAYSAFVASDRIPNYHYHVSEYTKPVHVCYGQVVLVARQAGAECTAYVAQGDCAKVRPGVNRTLTALKSLGVVVEGRAVGH